MGDEQRRDGLSRRGFLAAGGAVAAASALPVGATEEAKTGAPAINTWRTLGRTGFKVSDVSIGNGASDSNLFRYAYDHGINYIDTAEEYGNGNHEKLIGEALEHMDRSKVFITTKLELKEGDTEQTILDRYGKCLERLGTEHFDALKSSRPTPRSGSADCPAMARTKRNRTAWKRCSALLSRTAASISCFFPTTS
jgi:aryl-alcohol dehydrogenase-like predicted oxidoreductase